MKNLVLIPLTILCKHFEIEMSFFTELQEHGLIQFSIIEEEFFIKEDSIDNVEKIIRLNKELDINFQGIDAILNLLTRVKSLEADNQQLRNRLRLFDEF